MSEINLVHVHHNKPFTTSLIIAEGVGLKHKRVIELIRKHETSFLEFGTLPFQRAKSGGKQTEYAKLNENDLYCNCGLGDTRQSLRQARPHNPSSKPTSEVSKCQKLI